MNYGWVKITSQHIHAIGLEAEVIETEKQKRNKLLLLGVVKLHLVVYSLPDALVEPTVENKENISKGIVRVYAVWRRRPPAPK